MPLRCHWVQTYPTAAKGPAGSDDEGRGTWHRLPFLKVPLWHGVPIPPLEVELGLTERA